MCPGGVQGRPRALGQGFTAGGKPNSTSNLIGQVGRIELDIDGY